MNNLIYSALSASKARRNLPLTLDGTRVRVESLSDTKTSKAGDGKAYMNTTTTLFALRVCGLTAILLCGPVSAGADYSQWRGPNRDGISRETGVLRQWPEAGPSLLWSIDSAGSGYSTPSVSAGTLFILGNDGLENEFVEARALRDGKSLWKVRLGKVGNPDMQPKFPAARSTPTVDGDRLYVLGSDGDLACLGTAAGTIRWRKNLRTDFGGTPGTWAYSESPLVDGELLVCTPGGAEVSLVALDKLTGETKWKAPAYEESAAAYPSAIVMEINGSRQYVQMLEKGLVGVDAATGKLLWHYDRTVSKFKANIPTPVARGNEVFTAGAGTGAALVRIKPANGGFQAEEVYFSPKLPVAIGGAVLLGQYLYGTGNAGMMCVEFVTGEIKWDNRSLGAASICAADGMLFLHGENGEVALVEANPEKYIEKGRFVPANQPQHSSPMEKSWAYPVVADGRLLIRDHARLWCYDVRAQP